MLTLRDLRKRANKTQQEIAIGCDVTQTAVSRWERGGNPPLAKYFRRYALALGCTPAELKAAIAQAMKEEP